jgi:hypothetical protein
MASVFFFFGFRCGRVPKTRDKSKLTGRIDFLRNKLRKKNCFANMQQQPVAAIAQGSRHTKAASAQLQHSALQISALLHFPLVSLWQPEQDDKPAEDPTEGG